MTTYNFAPVAKGHLRKIWQYTEKKWDAIQAEKYLTGLMLEVEKVLAKKSRVYDCSSIFPTRQAIFYFKYESHRVVYREKGEVMEVIGIVHFASEKRMQNLLSRY